MGYNTQPSSSYLSISSLNAEVNLTTVATNRTLQSIVLPTYNGILSLATLDLYIMFTADISGALNYVDLASYIQIQDAGSTWRNALAIGTDLIYAPANSYDYVAIQLRGTLDLKSYLASGGTYPVRWENSRCLANNLTIKGIYSTINLYFA